jgi:16S rRNA (adenine1518-N6/adenine1519-N6)-dimethyltransferase
MYEANKSLGQNFLTDTNIAQTMAFNLNASNGDTVIEIGPGLGAVTSYVETLYIHTNAKLIAVEFDQRFIDKLNKMFAENPNISVVNEDVLKFLPKFESNGPIKIIGSLPFYITSPILHAIIKMKKQPEKVIIMIQKEVARKIINDAPDGSYLSAFTQTFYDVANVIEVPRTVFRPEPDVDATVISLTKNNITMPLEQIEKYEGFLHKAFKNPRKMLNKAFSKDELKRGDIDSSLRPQAVSAQRWYEFFSSVTQGVQK